MSTSKFIQKSVFIILTLALVMLFGCSSEDTERENNVLLTEATQDDFSTLKAFVEGGFGNGSTYALHFPDTWNGDLVVYAHGYAFPETEPSLPDAEDPNFIALRDAWMAQGYGVAFSSFSESAFWQPE